MFTKVTALSAGIAVLALAGCSSTTTVIEKVAAPVATVKATPTPKTTHTAKPKPKVTHSAAPVAVQTTPAAQAPTLLVVGNYSGIEPTTLDVGADNAITSVTWSQWSATGAVGTGQQEVDNCNPNCASGTVSWETVDLFLGGASNGKFTTFNETDAATGKSLNSFGYEVSQALIGAEGGTQGN